MKKFNDFWLAALAVSIMLTVLSACAADSHEGGRNARLVGLWKEENPTVHAITLRNQDGTYRRKVVQRYDYARPPITYEERGRWKVRGDQYVWTLDDISTPPWKNEVGKESQVKILSSDEKKFRHLSTDEAVVEEHRIGPASNAAFEKAQLDASVLASDN